MISYLKKIMNGEVAMRSKSKLKEHIECFTDERLEENRSNDKNVPIEIYDEDGYYQTLFEMLDVMKQKSSGL